MAVLAARTDKGPRKQTNEDACCAIAADTKFGEVLMAIVCDGVGGLARGELASSTVIDRFVEWFETELPTLIEGMVDTGAFQFSTVRFIWEALLQNTNELIQSYGTSTRSSFGTTFTGVIVCQGHYLVGHVGDCRLYQVGPRSFRQVTEDQTLLATKLASGEITPEEAQNFAQKNVIMQSVGTERVLKPAFYEGTIANDDMMVMLCDGAYRRVGGEGIRRNFQGIDYLSELAMGEACDRVIQECLDKGEIDNLTVVCFSGSLEEKQVKPITSVASMDAERMAAYSQIVDSVMADGYDDEDMSTMVFDDSREEEAVGSKTQATQTSASEHEVSQTQVWGAVAAEEISETQVWGSAEETPATAETEAMTFVQIAETSADIQTQVSGIAIADEADSTQIWATSSAGEEGQTQVWGDADAGDEEPTQVWGDAADTSVATAATQPWDGTKNRVSAGDEASTQVWKDASAEDEDEATQVWTDAPAVSEASTQVWSNAPVDGDEPTQVWAGAKSSASNSGEDEATQMWGVADDDGEDTPTVSPDWGDQA